LPIRKPSTPSVRLRATRSAADVTYFRRAMYPALDRDAIVLARPAGANFLHDGVASLDHHAARPIRSLFT
jgi:hypothetical protein